MTKEMGISIDAYLDDDNRRVVDDLLEDWHEILEVDKDGYPKLGKSLTIRLWDSINQDAPQIIVEGEIQLVHETKHQHHTSESIASSITLTLGWD